jgi:hypothetical protein
MTRLSSIRYRWSILLALALLMAVTRGNHVGSVAALPSASWAVFFLAGLYLPRLGSLGFFLVEAAALDLGAVYLGGVSPACITPAYFTLIPAYGALWGAGRLYRTVHRDSITTLIPLTALLLGGSVVCEVFSSGGFYWLSGQFETPSLAGFGERLVAYFPTSLGHLAIYVGAAVLAHVGILSLTRTRRDHRLLGAGHE